ncbi:MAG: hypothetical protein PHZ04_01590 [Patescibacteria group bacterium]|nr:hypothetical protein [Patescibacteria group bacterium]MDD5294570.1 hypothetical protein [Patescibacteria group bacterium]MDD5554936.1 hypothetical protein [Patescibacteria group bacterium]
MKSFVILAAAVLSLLVSAAYGRAEDNLNLEVSDVMAGMNYYEETEKAHEASGYYSWLKARYRPFWLVGQETEIGFGIFAQGEYPFGSSKGADYKNLQASGGLNFFWRRPGFIGDLDLGAGRLIWAKVKKDLYESEQKENIMLASAYFGFDSRRLEGNSFLPKTAFNLSLSVPFDQSSEREYGGHALAPMIYNNRRWEVSLLQEIVDFRSGGWRITPGIGGSYGRESDPQKNFYKAGPTLSFYRDRNLFRFSVNYQEQLAGNKDRWYAKVFYWRHLE